ncbi:hypothetical protein ACMYSQ_011268 [Aspergillus niger]
MVRDKSTDEATTAARFATRHEILFTVRGGCFTSGASKTHAIQAARHYVNLYLSIHDHDRPVSHTGHIHCLSKSVKPLSPRPELVDVLLYNPRRIWDDAFSIFQ